MVKPFFGKLYRRASYSKYTENLVKEELKYVEGEEIERRRQRKTGRRRFRVSARRW